jgi:DNA repair protein SbcD/Mre11
MKFLHAADLHIDSPLQGLERLEGAPFDEIRRAPREAFRRLVDLALKERVDFVILAGDVFDGRWKDVSTGLFFVAELKRLAPIPVSVALGNHDAMSSLTSRLPWPSHVLRFDSARPETFELPNEGVALHGQSFANRVVTEDLAAGYPPARSGLLNIGVLHTALGGYPGHESYAPTTLAVLRAKGYDAWCLGHVHQRQVLSRDPLVLYPGNIQGRHINECGERGCYLIDDDSGLLRETFHALDSLRWERIEIDATRMVSYDEVLAAAGARIAVLAEEHGERRLCLRVSLLGATSADAELRTAEANSDLRAELTAVARREGAWIESVRLRTTPSRSSAEIRSRGDLIGDLFSAFNQARSDQSLRSRLSDELRALQAKIPTEVVQTYHTRFDDGEGLDMVLDEAEALLRGRLPL